MQQVLAHGAVEEKALLRDVADAPAQPRLVQLVDRRAVEQDRALVVFVEAREQVDERGLARAGGADQRDGLARASPPGRCRAPWARCRRRNATWS